MIPTPARLAELRALCDAAKHSILIPTPTITRKDIEGLLDAIEEQRKEIERLRAVVDAAKDVRKADRMVSDMTTKYAAAMYKDREVFAEAGRSQRAAIDDQTRKQLMLDAALDAEEGKP